MRKTKIVCTLGPSCSDKATLKKMIMAGMDVARINMSHGVYDVVKEHVKNVNEAAEECVNNVSILLAPNGP